MLEEYLPMLLYLVVAGIIAMVVGLVIDGILKSVDLDLWTRVQQELNGEAELQSKSHLKTFDRIQFTASISSERIGQAIRAIRFQLSGTNFLVHDFRRNVSSNRGGIFRDNQTLFVELIDSKGLREFPRFVISSSTTALPLASIRHKRQLRYPLDESFKYAEAISSTYQERFDAYLDDSQEISDDFLMALSDLFEVYKGRNWWFWIEFDGSRLIVASSLNSSLRSDYRPEKLSVDEVKTRIVTMARMLQCF